jgi:hypothetical protein
MEKYINIKSCEGGGPRKKKGIDWWEVGGNGVTIPCDIDLTLVCICAVVVVVYVPSSPLPTQSPVVSKFYAHMQFTTQHKPTQIQLISIAKEISFWNGCTRVWRNFGFNSTSLSSSSSSFYYYSQNKTHRSLGICAASSPYYTKRASRT